MPEEKEEQLINEQLSDGLKNIIPSNKIDGKDIPNITKQVEEKLQLNAVLEKEIPPLNIEELQHEFIEEDTNISIQRNFNVFYILFGIIVFFGCIIAYFIFKNSDNDNINTSENQGAQDEPKFWR